MLLAWIRERSGPCPTSAKHLLAKRLPAGHPSTRRLPARGESVMNATHATVSVTLLVLLAGVLHATWNAMAKAIDDKQVAFGLIGGGCGAAAAVALPFTGMPGGRATVFALVSAAIHIGYNLALMRAYRLGAFGQTYPIARGTSPLLVAAGAWLFASEHLGVLQLLGVGTVAGGLVALVFVNGRPARAETAAIVAAVMTGVTIASYTLVDGLGVRHATTAFSYIALLFVAQGPILLAVALISRRHQPAWRSPRTLAAGLGAGLLSLAAYGIVIWAQTHGPLAVVSALRETSVISAAVIAAVWFHEPFGWRRLPPATAVVAGVVLLNL
jgi:drug/metabolite transporter (DMT)-like permease